VLADSLAGRRSEIQSDSSVGASRWRTWSWPVVSEKSASDTAAITGTAYSSRQVNESNDANNNAGYPPSIC
jgi:hypothetical protein